MEGDKGIFWAKGWPRSLQQAQGAQRALAVRQGPGFGVGPMSHPEDAGRQERISHLSGSRLVQDKPSPTT